jgi:hypothetical protein
MVLLPGEFTKYDGRNYSYFGISADSKLGQKLCFVKGKIQYTVCNLKGRKRPAFAALGVF